MKSIDQKQLQLLIAAGLILILFSVYQFVYRPLTDKTKAVEEENQILSEQAAQLSAKTAFEEKYRTEIKDYEAGIDQIKKMYGPGNSPEKTTKFIIDLCEVSGMTVPTVSFSEDVGIYPSGDMEYPSDTGLYLYTNTVSFTYSVTYEGLKKCIDYINTYPEHMNVGSILASYDSETGNLSGTMTVNQYAMTGSGTQYTDPVFDEVMTGKNSIFGTSTAQ